MSERILNETVIAQGTSLERTAMKIPPMPCGEPLNHKLIILSPCAVVHTTTARILAALEKSGWNKSRAARLLGISRRTIYRKMEELGIEDAGVIS